MSEVVSDYFDAANCNCTHNEDYHNLLITSDFLIVACDRCRESNGACFRAERQHAEALRTQRESERGPSTDPCDNRHPIIGVCCQLLRRHHGPHQFQGHNWGMHQSLRMDRCQSVSARTWRQCGHTPGHEGQHATATQAWGDGSSLCTSVNDYGIRCIRVTHELGDHQCGDTAWVNPCTSVNHITNLRCAGSIGHSGPHSFSSWTWRNNEPINPLNCDAIHWSTLEQCTLPPAHIGSHRHPNGAMFSNESALCTSVWQGQRCLHPTHPTTTQHRHRTRVWTDADVEFAAIQAPGESQVFVVEVMADGTTRPIGPDNI